MFFFRDITPCPHRISSTQFFKLVRWTPISKSTLARVRLFERGAYSKLTEKTMRKKIDIIEN